MGWLMNNKNASQRDQGLQDLMDEEVSPLNMNMFIPGYTLRFAPQEVLLLL